MNLSLLIQDHSSFCEYFGKVALPILFANRTNRLDMFDHSYLEKLYLFVYEMINTLDRCNDRQKEYIYAK